LTVAPALIFAMFRKGKEGRGQCSGWSHAHAYFVDMKFLLQQFATFLTVTPVLIFAMFQKGY